MQTKTYEIPEIDFYKRPDEVLTKPLGEVSINYLNGFNTYAEFHADEAIG